MGATIALASRNHQQFPDLLKGEPEILSATDEPQAFYVPFVIDSIPGGAALRLRNKRLLLVEPDRVNAQPRTLRDLTN
jgi:hypothetical protein